MSAAFVWPTQGWVESVAGRLLEASLWGAALAAAVWALGVLVPGLPAAWRRWLWWAVSLKLLLGLAPLPQVALPVLAPPPATAVAATQRSAAAPHAPDGRLAALSSQPSASLAERARGSGSFAATERAPAAPGLAARLLSALVAAWALGAALSLLHAAGEAWRAARLVRRAMPPADPDLRGRFARLAAELGTPGARLRLSPEVETPQLTGILRPTVLLPARAASLLAEVELEMAIAHELVHVRQRDLLVGIVPALAARLFFFHPLARLAAREHALAREAVCDAAVVGRFAPSPRDYGRLLLRLSLPNRAPLRAAVAAAAHHTLHRRLQMLLHPQRRTRAPWAWLAGAVALAVLVPFQLTASEPASDAAPAAPPTAAASPAKAPVTGAVARPVAPVGLVTGTPGVGLALASPGADARVAAAGAPVLPATLAPTVQAAYEASAAARARSEANREEDEWEAEWQDDSNDGRAFLLTYEEGHIMSGSRGDHARAERWRRGDERLLWFRRDAREWVIRDPAFLARATALWEPQHALGEQQAALGERQAALGSEQAELARRQAALGAEQAELAAQQAEVGAQQAAVAAREAALAAREYRASDEERRQLREQRRQLQAEREPLEERMGELGHEMGELGRRQGELGREQGELGRRQGELGKQQGELGREQGRLSRIAQRELWKMLDEAVASGLAQPME